MSITDQLTRRLGTAIDSVVMAVSPSAGIARRRMRASSNATGYMVPGGPQKSMKGFEATPNAPSVDIDRKLFGMRAAARDSAMNNSVAVSIYRRYRTNVIGAGLQVLPRPDADFLGLSKAAAEEWKHAAIREFDMWASSLESDHTGTRSFNEDQALVFMSSLVNGDIFFALPWVDARLQGWPYETVVKLIDADLVRDENSDTFTLTGPTNSRIRNGVEYDKSGRLVAYWVSNYYKSDYYGSSDDRKYTRIPVYDDEGERQIFHLLEHDRVEQRRGIPLLAPVVEDLKNVSRLSKSELTSALVASMFTVFVRDNSGMGGMLQQGFIPEESLLGGGGYGPDATQTQNLDSHAWDYQMGHGNIVHLDRDKTVEFADPKKNQDNYDILFKNLAIQISAAAEIPEEIVMLNFNKSYSALRGAVIEAWKRWRVCRQVVASRYCQPCYEAVMREAVIKGRIKAPRFFDDRVYRAAWCRSAWVGAGQGQIDPLKEAKASVMKIGYGLSTREEEYSQDRGGRWDPTIERLARENEIMDELGLVPDVEAQALAEDAR